MRVISPLSININPVSYTHLDVYKRQHLDRSQLWRQYQTVIIAVNHDEGTHQSGRNTP